MTSKLDNVLAETQKQPRVTFFLGASAAMGWDLNYEDLFALAEHTRSLVDCLDCIDAMRGARPSGRVQAALACLAGKRERESVAKRVRG